MSEFGWAYISGSNGGGVDDSVQVKIGNNLTGSEDFTYSLSTSTVALTGTLNVSGTINANAFNLDVTNKNVTNITMTGSTKFGDSSDDTHSFSGSMQVLGNVSSSLNMSASHFYGDGTYLTNITASTVSDPLTVSILSGSTAVSGAVGIFGEITGAVNASNLEGTVLNARLPTTISVTNVTASNHFSGALGAFNSIEGTLATPAQTNITSVGSLSSLTVTGDLTVDTSTLKVDSSNNRVGIGRADPQKVVEVLQASDTQLRLSHSKYVLGVSSNVYSDFQTLPDGTLKVSTTGNNVNLSSSVAVSGALSASSLHLSALTAGSASSSNFLALDSSNNVVLTSSSGGSGGSGGTIGAAEDGDYTDGLFTDFTTNTTVGIPIDRYNEVLKILAPSPAPSVRAINYLNSAGVAAKLSFDASNTITGYSSSVASSGFTAVTRSMAYETGQSGSNYRLGVYNNQDITGTVNFNVGESVTNGNYSYVTGAFANAETGSLKLELNGTVIHTVELAGLAGSGNPATGSASSLTNGAGFINVSITASSYDGNGAEWYIFKHRTARYYIHSARQHKGYNYLRVIHTVGSTDNETNYVEWVNDPDGAAAALSVANNRIENITLLGSKYLSGVQYNTGSTANYKAEISNMYRNVHPSASNTITFTVANSSQPSAQSVANLSGGDTNEKVVQITASLEINVNNLLSGSMTANLSATHPLKSNLSNAGSATTGNGFLVDSRTLASTNLIEKFHDESFRKISGSYNNQSDANAVGSIWNSENHMTASGATGHTDGLLFYNQRLYSPVDADIPNVGDFSTLSNVESSQPNYSGVSGIRSFFRVLTNSSGVTKRDLKIESTKSGTTYNNSGLGASNIHFFMKIPASTGWMDISQNYSYGSNNDGNGALINGASNDVDSGNNTHYVTFGTESVANNEFFMLKIEADESWSGYISELEFTLGATSNSATEAPALDDIDANNTGEDAKLSFGTNNSISDYSSATGSSISLTNYNTNDLYNASGDRRGIFSSTPTISGELNEDVSSSGNNYSTNAFKDAYRGSLIIEVNDTEVHSLNLLDTLTTTASYNSNGSGFEISAVSWSTTSDNIPDYTKPYRTGSYAVGASDQNVGWNYARVIHRIDASDTETNYVEWIVDPSGSVNNLTSSGTAMSNFEHQTVYYQSGVRYFAAAPSASYTYVASNVYRNVYQNGTAISFPTTTNCSISNIRISGSGINTTSSAASSLALGTLNNSSNCHLADFQVTGTVLFGQSKSLVGHGLFINGNEYTASVSSRILHPLKSNLTSSTQSKSGFLVFSGSVGASNENTEEYFNAETYRILSASHGTQQAATGSSNTWNSQRSMNDGGTYPAYNDGLLVFGTSSTGGFLVSPLMGGYDGNFLNADDGGSIQGPESNVNYSTGVLSSSTRSFFRYYRNNTVNDRSSVTVSMYGSGSLVEKDTSLGSNGNFHLEIKVPGTQAGVATAWLDVGKAYISNNSGSDGAGALVGGSSPTPIATGGTSVTATLNGGSVLGSNASGGSQVLILKVSAHKDWIGYLSRLKVAYS